uniref:Uncharacterized protein n=1 Tax=viral metagenome TaxID=1070528 RepID=A0A6C0AFJ7_9ZZZZ
MEFIQAPIDHHDFLYRFFNKYIINEPRGIFACFCKKSFLRMILLKKIFSFRNDIKILECHLKELINNDMKHIKIIS